MCIRDRVHPGILEGLVASVDPPLSVFTTSTGEIEDPFGAGLSEGPMTVRIAPGAHFEGDAKTEADFFSLWFELLGSQSGLEVEVLGVASGAPNEVVAYELEVEVEGPDDD